MKRRSSILTALLLFLSAAVSCEYDYDIPVLEGTEEAIVIDGTVVVGKSARISVSRVNGFTHSGTYAFGFSNDQREWWVEDSEGVRYMPQQNGLVDLKDAPTSRQYRAVVKTNGKTYSSSFQQPVEPPTIESFTLDNDTGNIYGHLSFDMADGSTDYAALSFEEIYEFHADYYKTLELDTKNWVVNELDEPDTTNYFCWTRSPRSREQLVDLVNLDGKAVDYKVTQFTRKDRRNHRDYNIKVWVRGLSPEEYRYLNTLKEQDGGNNLFTPNPGEIPSNVACEEDPKERVMGYVSVTREVTADAHMNSSRLIPSEPYSSMFVVPREDEILFWYNYGYLPIRSINLDMQFVTQWGPSRCIDCLEDGGKKTRPAFSE